jgi:signal transduction histidine kinase/DNA-binding NarL/FixJ family response regulator
MQWPREYHLTVAFALVLALFFCFSLLAYTLSMLFAVMIFTLSFLFIRRELARCRQSERLLRQAEHHQNEFLAMLSHELRNPLAPIRTAVVLLRRPALSETQIVWAREVIDRQLQHLSRIVDDLLDISRLTQGRVTLRKAPLKLTTIIDQALETSRPVLEARKHALMLALPPKPVWLEGDLTRLVQVVSDLLDNAAKYTHEGGRISLTAGAEDKQAVISVSDNGIGIAPELLPRVFDLFMQSERPLDRAQGGLGLGLSLVKRLVELHGGTVEAGSPGLSQGSTFTVRLPRLAAAPLLEAAAPESAPRDEPSPRLRVLVVDDNIDAAEGLALWFRLIGFEERIALDGPAALIAAEDFRPEVVILDIGLPGLDGFEVARRLRAQPGMAHALLIALSGYGPAQDQRCAQATGFDYHLAKPVDLDKLYTLIHKYSAKRVNTMTGGVTGISALILTATVVSSSISPSMAAANCGI